MSEYSRDPIVNAVHGGIKRPIRVLLENGCYPAAVQLILSGIDAMAYLGLPENQENVQRSDFVRWAEAYIQFPCTEQLTGLDLYGARCSMLHQHGAESSLSREGRCRQVGYMDMSIPEVRYIPKIGVDLVLVSVPALADAFFKGIDRYLVALFADPTRSAGVEKRLRKLVLTLPRPEGDIDSLGTQ